MKNVLAHDQLLGVFVALKAILGNAQVFCCPVSEWQLGGEPVAVCHVPAWLPSQPEVVTLGLFVSLVCCEHMSLQREVAETWTALFEDTGLYFEDLTEYLEEEDRFEDFE